MILLYIDDDPEDREIFVEAVREIDATIYCYLASDGMEALQLLPKLPIEPNFIFADINMPVKSGKEFLVEIKRVKRFASIPVILYSTTSHAAEISQYRDLGAHDFIVKPNTFTHACEIIRSALAGEKIGLLSKDF